jgi:hypothetical protein
MSKVALHRLLPPFKLFSEPVFSGDPMAPTEPAFLSLISKYLWLEIAANFYL